MTASLPLYRDARKDDARALAQLIEIAGAGHLTNIERPAAVTGVEQFTITDRSTRNFQQHEMLTLEGAQAGRPGPGALLGAEPGLGVPGVEDRP